MRIAKCLIWVSFFSLHAVAQTQSNDIDTFINSQTTPTYDCPDASDSEQVDLYLQEETLTTLQTLSLKSMQTHGFICNGDNDVAEDKLIDILDDYTALSDTRAYASAIYQLGFVYDLKSNPLECEYYQQAQALARDRYIDVHLSASLAMITECDSQADEGVRLGKLFTLLEHYADKADPGALAHIHNNIGLLFGAMGQHVLAAEQYMKAHRIGLEIYTGSNQLSILISAITSHMASGNFDQAKDAIDEFRDINQNVNTPLTNFWLLFAEAGYYYRTEQYGELRTRILAWDDMKEDINSVTYNNLFRWYASVLCLAEQDRACLTQFLIDENNTSDGYKRYVGGNKDYLKFITDVQFFLGDIEQAQLAYEQFAKRLIEDKRNDQASGRILGIANLYSQINNLETRLEKSRQLRNRLIFVGSLAILVLILGSSYLLYQRRITRESIDPVTQLLNNKTALARIERVETPSEGKTNALAIFDLGNFREVNRIVGSTKADYVLQQIAQTLTDITRDSDILGRFAPEQFILCLPDIEEETAKSFFERIRQALENTQLSEAAEKDISVRSSMSIYIASERFDDITDVLDDMVRSLSLQNELGMPSGD